VEVDACRLSVARRVAGADRVAVILHAQLGVEAVFRPRGEALAGWDVAIPDLRGRGRSVCRDESMYSWPRLVDDVVAVCDRVAGNRRVLLAGSSFGSGLAVATALAHPDRVAALVLWAPPYAGAAAGWTDGQRAIQQRNLAAAPGDGPKWARHDPESITAALRGLGFAQPFDDVAQLDSIGVAVAVSPGADDLHLPWIGGSYLRHLGHGERIDESTAAFSTFARRGPN